jgi:serine/threonine protein kinase
MTERALQASKSRCLDDEELLAFAGGRLSPTRRDFAHRHLDVCDVCQQLLNEAVRGLATAKTGTAIEEEQVAWRTMFRPGMLVGGRYVVRRFIARGGMGEIYEAFDEELQERVALKTVTSTASDNPSAVRRLKAEVQLARRVGHPNVCRIYDFGTHLVAGTGAPISFFTMEFVEGETLGERIRQNGPLPVEDARRLGRQLLHGLGAAHAAGVLHRDFKSDNVILRREGERYEPVILDFGLARASDQDVTQSSGSVGGLVGTLAYMPPDQLEGKPYTTASDVYSFGLVWYEMLTGELPFKARSSPAITTLDRLTRPVPLPSSKNPAVPPDLDAIVIECLRRSASDRPQTAADVLAQLDELTRKTDTLPPASRGRSVWTLAIASLVLATAYFALTRKAAVTPAPPRAAASTRITIAAARPASPVTPAAPPFSSTAEPSSESATVKARSASAPAPSSRAQPAASISAATEPRARKLDPVPLLDAARSVALSSTKVLEPERRSDSREGWENPFAAAALPPSSELGAVLEQPLDRRAPAGDTQLSEGSR